MGPFGPPLGVNLGKAYDEKRKQISRKLNLESIWIQKKFRKAVREDRNGVKKNFIYNPVNGGIIRVTPYTEGSPSYDRWLLTRPLIQDVKSYGTRVSLLSHMIHVIAACGLKPAAWHTLKRVHLVCFTTHINNLRKMVKEITHKSGTRYDIRTPMEAYALPYYRPSGRDKILRNEGITLPLYEKRVPRKREDWC